MAYAQRRAHVSSQRRQGPPDNDVYRNMNTFMLGTRLFFCLTT